METVQGRWRLAGGLAAASLVVAACGGADSSAPERTDPTIAQATTTTGPYDVPEVIDAAYVDRVLAGLTAVEGDALRLVMRERSFPREAWDRLRAIYGSEKELDLTVGRFLLEIREGFPGFLPNPGNRRMATVQLIRTAGDPPCIFAEVSIDFSQTALEPRVIPGGRWVGLVTADPKLDPLGFNPTGWAYHYNGFESDDSVFDRACPK